MYLLNFWSELHCQVDIIDFWLSTASLPARLHLAWVTPLGLYKLNHFFTNIPKIMLLSWFSWQNTLGVGDRPRQPHLMLYVLCIPFITMATHVSSLTDNTGEEEEEVENFVAEIVWKFEGLCYCPDHSVWEFRGLLRLWASALECKNVVGVSWGM